MTTDDLLAAKVESALLRARVAPGAAARLARSLGLPADATEYELTDLREALDLRRLKLVAELERTESLDALAPGTAGGAHLVACAEARLVVMTEVVELVDRVAAGEKP